MSRTPPIPPDVGQEGKFLAGSFYWISRINGWQEFLLLAFVN
jgi:hypothetical protein